MSCFFIKYLWISIILLVSKALYSTKKLFIPPFNPVFFFMLLAEKCPEIFPKHKGYFFVSEYFALNEYIFVALIN